MNLFVHHNMVTEKTFDLASEQHNLTLKTISKTNYLSIKIISSRQLGDGMGWRRCG